MQRCQIGESLIKLRHKRLYQRLFVLGEHHHSHSLTYRRSAHHKVTHQTFVAAAVVIVVAVAAGEFAQPVTQLVRRTALQPALIDVDNPIEHTLHMEAKSLSITALLIDFDISGIEPATVGECIFELVAVELGIVCTYYIINRHIAYSADACKLVAHLLLLVEQLFLVRKHLPLASSTLAEVTAERFHAIGRRLYNFEQLRLRIILAFACKHHVYHIARDNASDKNHIIVVAPHSNTLGGHSRNLKVLNYFVFFLRHFPIIILC